MKNNQSFNGSIEVCGHTVDFYFNLDGVTLTDEIENALTQEAESRARKCIAEDFFEGELNSCGDERELSGWWKIRG